MMTTTTHCRLSQQCEMRSLLGIAAVAACRLCHLVQSCLRVQIAREQQPVYRQATRPGLQAGSKVDRVPMAYPKATTRIPGQPLKSTWAGDHYSRLRRGLPQRLLSPQSEIMMQNVRHAENGTSPYKTTSTSNIESRLRRLETESDGVLPDLLEMVAAVVQLRNNVR